MKEGEKDEEEGKVDEPVMKITVSKLFLGAEDMGTVWRPQGAVPSVRGALSAL